MKIVEGKDGKKYVDGCIDYAQCLVAAGAELLDYAAFGDYQGTWVAIVRYENKIFVVSGSYGSCSGCDALEATLDDYWDVEAKDGTKIHGYLYDDMVKFGEPYLDDPRDIDKAIEDAEKNAEWDCESVDTAKWLKDMKAKHFDKGGRS